MPTVSDSFTNTNGTALASHNANWTVHNGVFTIQGNECEQNNPGGDSWATYAGTFANDQYAEATVSATLANGAFSGLVVRCNTSGTKTYYAINWDIDSTFFYEYVAGTYTQYGAPGAPFSAGDLIRLEIIGTALKVYQNGSVYASQTTSAIASGSPGLTGFSGTGTRLDNWVGSDQFTVTPKLFVVTTSLRW